ncbi:phosphatidylglycerol lysyltransferase domain-containing protein [Gelidibacter salicanalis]|uniref:Lysylphosphatidylglycerol synthetase family protein n=1 Tax=Gelidibacter salicanalis TaxID=291193 RepID=A0A934KVQ5_9FLAO|nr:phosphatidylglycerol lysyltransferase domain-containing protein [Gelidibacter salicanalis]MBJ7881718.1 lysylphosphatidylglycerol synthetase family protein [Gelidibacter salicanalis]
MKRSSSKQVTLQWKRILKIALGIGSVFLAIYFVKHEGTELTQVKSVLIQAKTVWLVYGMVLVLLFVAVQGWMYYYSFKAIKKKIPFRVGLLLYLKRNFISVFIPAGTLTNMLFFNTDIEEKQGIGKNYIYYASTIFSVCSILSSILVALPAIVLLSIKGNMEVGVIYGIIALTSIFGALIYVIISINKHGFIYRQLVKRAPKFAKILRDLQEQSIDKIQVLKVLLLSGVIEVIGIAHLYIATGALGLKPSLMVAVIGYALVLLILLSSPFLRGIGAIELALTYALTLFNFSAVSALSVVFLFRFFEFWSVMILGLFVIIFKKDGLLMQLLAPVLLLFLGIVNILSALTPALDYRLKFLKDFIPYNIIEMSNTAVLVIGIILMFTAVALIKGYKNSYYLAMVLSVFSLIGHLFKGIDYEEAILASATILVLLYQRRTYYIRSIPLNHLQWQNGLIYLACVLIYGVLGFYSLDARHFKMDFTLSQSILGTVKSFVLLDVDLHPVTAFGRYFLTSINLLGVFSMLYVFWLLFKRFRQKSVVDENQFKKAKLMVQAYGNSSMDYFKTYADKQFYFFEDGEGFISYKATKSYAVVLENPVLKHLSAESIQEKIKEFELAMLSKNLNAIYYRIPEQSLKIYENLGKKKLLLGEDAFVNLETFSLEGRNAKPLRNAINKLKKKGFYLNVNHPPQTDAFLKSLKSVSDSWLQDMDRKELCFSQGVFSESELRTQTLLTIENANSNCVAFINVVESSVKGQVNFDLMRKIADAHSGTMDFLIAEMLQYYKTQGFNSMCLGMVPLSGIEKPENITEQALKLAYEKIKQFGHYKSLRFFKEKFNPFWIKVYVIYDTGLDLVNLTRVLGKVMKPNKTV